MVNRSARQPDELVSLEQIPNVGPAIGGSLRRLGIAVPGDLVGRDPWVLYRQLCELDGRRHDPCVLDVFMAAVGFMQGDTPRPWWKYTAQRKRMLAAEQRQSPTK